MSESVERSTERHHASINTADVKRDAAERFLRDDYRRALMRLLDGERIPVSTPANKYFKQTNIMLELFDELEELRQGSQEIIAELLAIAYALSCASDELETRDVRAKAVALITRLEDEHVSTHLDAAVEE